MENNCEPQGGSERRLFVRYKEPVSSKDRQGNTGRSICSADAAPLAWGEDGKAGVGRL